MNSSKIVYADTITTPKTRACGDVSSTNVIFPPIERNLQRNASKIIRTGAGRSALLGIFGYFVVPLLSLKPLNRLALGTLPQNLGEFASDEYRNP